ncbi:MAG TPA: S9 family peptidase [Terracidiphilus sp.]|jgi:dipeptidyl aminopeptidase/acylaminoacyl peptidase|nr:S9 family peptidase [Terracidiphilus sp.]
MLRSFPKNLLCSLFCLGLLPSLFSSAQAADTPKKRDITLDDLAKLQRVGSPVVSPDGDWVIYTVSQTDTKEDKGQSHLWMVKWDGSVHLQLTFGKEGASEPKFSPDGRYISFMSSRPGPAKGDQVWVMDRRGGEAEQFTAITDQNIEGYSWSPDSKRLLLTMRPKSEPDAEEGKPPAPPKPVVIDRYHFKQDVQGYLRDDEWNALYLYDIAAKKSEKLTTDKNVNENEAEWSPDGKWIAYVSNHDADPDRTNNSDIFIVETKAGSTPKKLTKWNGPDSGPLAWSSDSQSIAYTEGAELKLLEYSQSKPAVVSLDGKISYAATKLDRSVRAPIFTNDGHLSYLVNDDRNQYPAELELNGGGSKRLLAQQGAVMSWNAAGGHIAVSYTNDADPAEIFAFENGALRKLTTHNDALMAELNLVSTDDVEFKSQDGTEVHGLLTKPAGFKSGSPVPMILFIHGGPNGQDEHSFDFLRQWLATKGYAELNVNYRGSSGRGQAYAKAIAGDWGHFEVQDLLAGVDKAVALGVADPNRMCVTGWSYGGILTDYTTASTDRFKCAISGAGVAAPMSFYGVDQYIQQYDNELGPPWQNLQLYIKMSYPFLEVEKRIHTPMMFMGGTSDMNVPLIGGEQMYEALKSLGRPTELVVYPNQFHGFTRPSFIKDRYERWLAWWDKYTKPASDTKPAADAKKGE